MSNEKRPEPEFNVKDSYQPSSADQKIYGAGKYDPRTQSPPIYTTKPPGGSLTEEFDKGREATEGERRVSFKRGLHEVERMVVALSEATADEGGCSSPQRTHMVPKSLAARMRRP